MPIPGIDSEALANYERELASLRLEGELLSLRLWLRGFHPDQLRVPAGNPDGGEWTIGASGAGDARIEPAQELLIGKLPPFIENLLRTGRIGAEDLTRPKEPIPGLSGKESANRVPSWARGERPMVKESGKDFAKRLLDEKYGPGRYEKGPNSEFNQIQKWGDRHFRIPKSFFDGT